MEFLPYPAIICHIVSVSLSGSFWHDRELPRARRSNDCNGLQITTTYYNTLHHTATCCNKRQDTATTKSVAPQTTHTHTKLADPITLKYLKYPSVHAPLLQACAVGVGAGPGAVSATTGCISPAATSEGTETITRHLKLAPTSVTFRDLPGSSGHHVSSCLQDVFVLARATDPTHTTRHSKQRGAGTSCAPIAGSCCLAGQHCSILQHKAAYSNMAQPCLSPPVTRAITSASLLAGKSLTKRIYLDYKEVRTSTCSTSPLQSLEFKVEHGSWFRV